MAQTLTGVFGAPELPVATAVTSTRTTRTTDWRKRAREIAEEEGVDPDLFEKLVKQESGFKTDAKSKVGARGLAQLMPTTARELGVNIDDPEDNLRGGARYLKQQLDSYQDTGKALAAYNAGPGAVDKHGGIPPYAETEDYVRSILGKDAVPQRAQAATGAGGRKGLADAFGAPDLKSVFGEPDAAKPTGAAKQPPQQASASLTPARLLKSALSPVPAVQRAGRSISTAIEGVERPASESGGLLETIKQVGTGFKEAPGQAALSLAYGLSGLEVIPAAWEAVKAQFEPQAYSPAARIAEGKSATPSILERLKDFGSQHVTAQRGMAAGVVEGAANLSPAEILLMAAGKKVGPRVVKGTRQVKTAGGVSVEPVMGRESLGGRAVRQVREKLRGDKSAVAPAVKSAMDEDVLQGLGREVERFTEQARGTRQKPNTGSLAPRGVKKDGTVVGAKPGGALDRYVKKAIEEGEDVIRIRKEEARAARNKGGRLGGKAPTLASALDDALKEAGMAEKVPSVELPPSEPPPQPKLGSRTSDISPDATKLQPGAAIPEPGGGIGNAEESARGSVEYARTRAREQQKLIDDRVRELQKDLAARQAARVSGRREPRGVLPFKKGGSTVEPLRATTPEEVSEFVRSRQAEAQAAPGTKELPPLARKGAAAQSTPAGGGVSAAKAPSSAELDLKRRNLMKAIKRTKTGDSALDKKLNRFHYLAGQEKPTPAQLVELGKLEQEVLANPALPEKLKGSWNRYNAKAQAPRAVASTTHDQRGIRIPTSQQKAFKAHTKIDEVTQQNVKLEQELRGAQRAAEVDPLTGVANRQAFDRAIAAAEADPATSVVVFDANNFGQVNKKVGQKAGDGTLKEVADAIRSAAELSGVGQRVFRRGGDEFVVLAPKEVADTVRSRAEAMFGSRKYGDVEVSLSGTVGGTFDEADAVLQGAKAARKAKGKAAEKAQLAALEAAGEARYRGKPDSEVRADFDRLTKAVAGKDKTPDYIPTAAEQALHDQDWKAYSRQRGFSESDIAEYEDWLKASFEMDRRKLDPAASPAAKAVETAKEAPLTQRSQEAMDRVFPEQAQALSRNLEPLLPTVQEVAPVIDEILAGMSTGDVEFGPLRPHEQMVADFFNTALDEMPTRVPDIRETKTGAVPPVRKQITAPAGFEFGKGRDRMSMAQSPEARQAREVRTKVFSQFKPKPQPTPDIPTVGSVADIKLTTAAGPDARPVRRQTLAEQKAAQQQEIAKGAPKGVDPALWKEVQATEAAARDLIEQYGILDPRLIEIMRRFWGSTETARRLGLEAVEKGRRVPDRGLVEQLSGAPHRQRPMTAMAAEMDDRFRFLIDNPNGFARVEALVAGSGLVAGGLVGAAMEGEDLFERGINTLSMALIGGAIGFGGAKALKGTNLKLRDPRASMEALDTANMLAGPAAIKASFGSLGGVTTGIVQRILEGNTQAARAGLRYMWKEAPNTYWKALTAPTSTITGPYTARVVQGMGATGIPQKILANVTRPFAAADQAGSGALRRMGFSTEEAERMMLMGEPTSWQGQSVLRLINSNMVFRLLAKFPRVRIAQFERGLEYLPGVPERFSPRSSKPDVQWGRAEFKQQEGLSRAAWKARKKIGGAVMVAGTAYGYWRDPSLAEMGLVSSATGPVALPATMSMAAGKALRSGKEPITDALVTAAASVPQISEADVRRWKERGTPLRSLRSAIQKAFSVDPSDQ